jgi:hypothetical protein
MTQSSTGVTGIDALITVRADMVEDLLATLNQQPLLAPDAVPSAGATGGGEWVDIMVTLAPSALGFVAGIIAMLARRSEVTVTIGQTTLKQSNINSGRAEELITKALEIEKARSKSQSGSSSS